MDTQLSPALAILSLIVLAIFIAIAMGGIVVWGVVFYRLANRIPIIPHEPRRMATWGLIDLILFVVIVMVTATMALAAAHLSGFKLAKISSEDPQTMMWVMLIESAAMLFAAMVLGGFIMLRSRSSLKEMGFSTTDFLYDLKIGTAAFAALAIPTYAIQLILVQFWPSKHPLIETLREQKNPEFLAIALFAAVIAAPLWEEFVFRGLLQGWLEKLFDPLMPFRPAPIANLLVGDFSALTSKVEAPDEKRIDDAPVMATLSDTAVNHAVSPYDANQLSDPYRPPAEAAQGLSPFGTSLTWYDDRPPTLGTDITAIGISATVFALMHWSHGPDWVPLLLLASGIGYLYRRTHRITPGLAVHFLLNAVSMLGTCVEIYRT